MHNHLIVENLIAALALIHVALAVVDHMVLQIHAVRGNVLADGAFVRLPLPVNTQVLLDIALVATAVKAQTAAVGPVTPSNVLHQIGFCRGRITCLTHLCRSHTAIQNLWIVL